MCAKTSQGVLKLLLVLPSSQCTTRECTLSKMGRTDPYLGAAHTMEEEEVSRMHFSLSPYLEILFYTDAVGFFSHQHVVVVGIQVRLYVLYNVKGFSTLNRPVSHYSLYSNSRTILRESSGEIY